MANNVFNKDMSLEELISALEEFQIKSRLVRKFMPSTTNSRLSEAFESSTNRCELELKYFKELRDLRKKHKVLKMMLNSYQIAESKGVVEKNNDDTRKL